MEFLLGVLITAAYFVCGFVAYNMGKRSIPAQVAKEAEVNEEERRKAERRRKEFDQLMGYNETIARSGKR